MTRNKLFFLMFLLTATAVVFSNYALTQTKQSPVPQNCQRDENQNENRADDTTSLTQTKSPSIPLVCERNEKLFRNEQNEIITLDHQQLKHIAVEQVSPKYPRSCRCLGIIKVAVLIDVKGKVKCVNTTEGNPLLRASAMQAAKKWKFEPVLSNDKSIAARGELVFEFSSDGQVTY